MRALLALLVVLVALLGAFYLLVGNPLEWLRQAEPERAEVLQAPAPQRQAVVAGSSETGDATPPEVTPRPAPAAAGADTPLASAGSGAPPAPADQPAAVEAEARQFLKTLTEPTPEPVAAENADHFVRADQMINMVPESAVETTTLGELKADPTLQPDTPITIVRTIEQIEASTPERVIARSEGNLDAPIRVLDEPGAAVRETTVREVLEEHRRDPSKPIMVVREVEHLEVTTLEKLEAEMRRADSAGGGRAVQGEPQPMTLVPAPKVLITRDSGIEPPDPARTGASSADAADAKAGPSAATAVLATPGGGAGTAAGAGGPDTAAGAATQPSDTVVVITGDARPAQRLTREAVPAGEQLPLMQRPIRIVRMPTTVTEATVREILLSRNEEVEPESIFYVRTVQSGDGQGIWGIVHHGIVDNFARGVAIRRGEEINTYRVNIPPDADEVQDDRRSSFLGRLIYDKARESHVYNYRLNRMGQNPDTIFPGQELVIIQFRPQELVSIYRHFVEQQG